MSHNNRQLRAIRRLYAQVPAMLDCKGRCHDSCTVIAMSRLEAQHLEQVTGQPPTYDARGRCGYLTTDNRCSVYEDRPLICRLLGTLPALPCEHGCRPVRRLTNTQAAHLLGQADRLGDGSCRAQPRPGALPIRLAQEPML